jgi:hypothetical protein
VGPSPFSETLQHAEVYGLARRVVHADKATPWCPTRGRWASPPLHTDPRGELVLTP